MTYDEVRQYWREQLDGDLQEMVIDYGYKEKTVQKSNYKTTKFIIDQRMTDKLMNVCKNNDMMLYIYLMAAFEVMLYKLTGTQDICLGVPCLTKGPSTENLAVLIKSMVSSTMSYREFLNKVKRNIMSGYQNQSYLMEEALVEVNCPIPYQNFVKYAVTLDSIHSPDIAGELIHSLQSDFVISFTKNSTLAGIIQYNSNRVPEEFLQTLSKVYIYIIQQTLQDLDLIIKKILVVDKEEMGKLEQWNQTVYDFKVNETIDRVFEKNVCLYGKKTALVYVKNKELDGCMTMDYETLAEKSNQLVHVLLRHGIKRGDSVGIIMPNSLELVIAMLSILKVGGAFVPMDTEYPKERVSDIVKDASIKLLLTKKEKNLEEISGTTILYLEALDWNKISKEPVTITKSLEDTAYIIYTSGSTGTPKGVRISHKSFLNFILWRIKAYQYSTKEVSLQLISPAFDGSLTNIFPILLSGGRCVYIHNSLWRDVPFINQVIANQKITNFSVVPTMYRLLAEQADTDEWTSIRFIVLAGEVTKPSLIKLTKDKYPHVLLINEYGPTEATITATAKPNMDSSDCNCIGKPIANTSAYILNEDGNILPSGVVGELCIAGIGVVSGYIGLREEEQQKFCINPYNPEENMYKTGDTARWNYGGQLEYLGRKDRLVKLHGLRIELEEITSILLAQENISDAYVWIHNENGREELVGVVESCIALDMDSVKEKLREKLPYYMIPGRLKQVDVFPVNCNGKIELDVLSSLIELDENTDYTEPLNEVEQYFTELWASLLHQNNFNIHSKFFDIGGNSMLIMLMHNEVEKKYPGTLTIPDYFSCATIKKLAEMVIDRSQKN
jgi:amino acid adenylation domain-containing protein